MTVIKKPMLTDSTGLKIVETLEKQNTILGALAGVNVESQADWSMIKSLVKNGEAKNIYDFGDQFVDTWTDTVNSKSYEFPWQVNHFEDVTLEDGETIPGMYLQMHYAHPFGVQFSQARAFYKCPDGLQAGTYHVKLEKDWGTYAKKDTYWQFTLTQAVPENGKLAGFIQMPDVTPANWKVVSYQPNGIDKIETVNVTSGQGGTDLGTMLYDTRSGNMNSMQETAYGWNRWKTSALRQYLNSDKKKGEWWTAQDEWDIAPDQLSKYDGFLCGMPKEMLDAMKTVKVSTYTNTVQNGGEDDITYDKVFLPSLKEIHCVPQIEGEGNIHEYWKRKSGSATPLAQYGTYPQMITYAVENHLSAQYVRLRSALRSDASNTWRVRGSGYIGYNHAWNALRFSPLIVIG